MSAPPIALTAVLNRTTVFIPLFRVLIDPFKKGRRRPGTSENSEKGKGKKLLFDGDMDEWSEGVMADACGSVYSRSRRVKAFLSVPPFSLPFRPEGRWGRARRNRADALRGTIKKDGVREIQKRG